MSHPINEEILENIYDEVVQESITNLVNAGFKDVTEKDLNADELHEETRRRFDELCIWKSH